MNADELTGRSRLAPFVPAAKGDQRPPRRFDTADLFDGSTEIEIVHEQAIYRLKITRQGKLILNK